MGDCRSSRRRAQLFVFMSGVELRLTYPDHVQSQSDCGHGQSSCSSFKYLRFFGLRSSTGFFLARHSGEGSWRERCASHRRSRHCESEWNFPTASDDQCRRGVLADKSEGGEISPKGAKTWLSRLGAVPDFASRERRALDHPALGNESFCEHQFG